MVHVGGIDREPGDRVGQVDPLFGQEGLDVAAAVRVPGRRSPVDRDVHLPQRVRARDRPVAAHREDGPRTHEAGERVLPVGALGPRNGIVRWFICPSYTAHSGCALATTPSARNRGTSSGWITWMWAM